MKRVLLSAYACLPNHGSEEENSWNYATLLSQEGLVIDCITQEKFRSTIEAIMSKDYYPNLTFHYVSVPNWVQNAYGNLIGMYFHYLFWQWKAAELALKLDRRYGYDLVHHISYSSIQLGSFMYKVGKPFIFGPVGGGQEAPRALKSYFGRYWSRERLRSGISLMLQYLNPGFFHTLKVADLVLISNSDTYRLARRFRPDKPMGRVLDSSISATFLASRPIKRQPGPSLKLLWVGRLMPRKALELTIDAFSKVNPDLPITLTIVGGKGEMAAEVPHYLERYGVKDRVEWVGQVPYDKVRAYYEESDVFFFTSLRDSCPAQIIEAMAYSMPVVTLGIHGQNELVDHTTGFKIPVTTKEQVTTDLAKAIEWLYEHPKERIAMGQNAFEFARSQVWETKIKKYVDEVYPALFERKTLEKTAVNK